MDERKTYCGGCTEGAYCPDSCNCWCHDHEDDDDCLCVEVHEDILTGRTQCVDCGKVRYDD